MAQGIEYAAWASKLLYENIVEKRFDTMEKFVEAFTLKFCQPPPDVLNDSQRILLVEPEISDSTAAVIEYLAGSFRMSINAVSFDIFALDEPQVLVRQFVREETVIEPPPPRGDHA